MTALLAVSPDIRAGAMLFSSAHTTNKVHIISYPVAEHSPTPELRIHASMPPLPHTSSWHILNQEYGQFYFFRTARHVLCACNNDNHSSLFWVSPPPPPRFTPYPMWFTNYKYRRSPLLQIRPCYWDYYVIPVWPFYCCMNGSPVTLSRALTGLVTSLQHTKQLPCVVRLV